MRRIVLIAVIAGLLSSCQFVEWMVGERSELRFTVPAGAISVASSTSPRAIMAAEIDPTYVGVMSLDEQDQFLEWLPLDDNPIVVYVPKDKVYAIMVYGEDLDGRLVPAGPVRLGSFDLDLLPVSADGQRTIDLGVLTGELGGFVSSVSEVEVADALGYSRDVLREFGAHDGQIIKMFNPDANGNGRVDREEGIAWGLFLTIEQTMLPAAETLSPDPSLRRNDLMTVGGVTYSFWTTEDLGRYFTSDELDELSIELPQEVYNPDTGQTGSLLAPYFGGPAESGNSFGPIIDHGGTYGTGAFGFYSIGQLEPPGPYEGDHVVHIGADRYRIDSVSFVSDASHVVGIPFPVYEAEISESDALERVEWQWFYDTGSGIAPASPEYVRLMVSAFAVQLGPWVTPGPEGLSFDQPDGWQDGGVLTTDDFGTVDLTASFLNFYLRDLRGNTYQHWCNETYRGS